MVINNKTKNFEAYKNGVFGNTLRTWYSLDDFFNSSYSGSVTLRYNGNSGNQFCAYNVKNVKEQVDVFLKQGANYDLFIVNESAPDDYLTIQGELTKNYKGYQLFYSTKKGKMRDCLKEAISIQGISVKVILEHYLTPNSFSDIMELLDLFPDHIIEFSTYSMNLGNSPRRNTIIWEIRNY